MGSIAMGWLACLATTPSLAGWFLAPLSVFAGPICLLQNLQDVPEVGACVLLYGCGVGWLFWKPSGWSAAVFILLSLVWWLIGCGIVSVAV